MNKDQRHPPVAGQPSENAVREYLRAHPEFFSNHPDLLETMELAHESGSAISLVERQIAVMRERNVEMRHRLNHLLEAARTNDLLFEKTKRMVLNLLEAVSLPDVVNSLYESLGTDYQIPFYSLLLFGDPREVPATQARVVGHVEAQGQVGTLLRSSRAICGVLRADELQFLFGTDAARVGSVAAVPLGNGNLFGILAVGNSDANHYRSSMGTLFLSYIAEVLNRIIPRHLPA